MGMWYAGDYSTWTTLRIKRKEQLLDSQPRLLRLTITTKRLPAQQIECITRSFPLLLSVVLATYSLFILAYVFLRFSLFPRFWLERGWMSS